MPQVIKKVTKRKGSAPVTQTVIVNVSKGRRGGKAVPKGKAMPQPASMNVGQSLSSEYAQLTGVPYLGHIAGRYPGMIGGFNQPLHIVSEKESLEKQLVQSRTSLEELKKQGIVQKPLMVDSSIQAKPLIEVIRDMPSTKSISIGTDISMNQAPIVIEKEMQQKPMVVEMGIQEKPLPMATSSSSSSSLPEVVKAVMPEQEVVNVDQTLNRLDAIPVKIKGSQVAGSVQKDLLHLVRAVNGFQNYANKFSTMYGKPIELGLKSEYVQYLRKFPADTDREYRGMGY